MKSAQSTLRKPPRREHGKSDFEPSKLGSTLRDLAVRAHQLVRDLDTSDSRAEKAQELAEVHAQIVRLQRVLNANQLDELATYVSALRQRVAECLG
jgi:hypothetical protein